MEYITEEQFKKLEERVNNIEKKIDSSPEKLNKRPKSITEFLKEKDIEGDVVKTLCIAYFIEIKNGNEGVTSGDVKDGFQKARYKAPGNIPDYLSKCGKRGFMQEKNEKKDNKKLWTLTNTGIDYVENLGKKK